MAPTTRKTYRPRISASNACFATIVVGKNQQKFTVHEALLTHYSAYFQKALNGSFKESISKVVSLASEDETTFELFVHWLIYQRFPDAEHGDHRDLVGLWKNEHDRGELQNYRIARLYILGDVLVVPKLKDEVLTEFFNHVHPGLEHLLPDPPMINMVFGNLPASDPLCRLFVDLYCHWEVAGNYVERKTEDYFPCFWFGLARRYAQMVHCKRFEKDSQEHFPLQLGDYKQHSADDYKHRPADGRRVNPKRMAK